MDKRYVPGESPAEVNEAFARCAATGEILLAATGGNAALDRKLCEAFVDFARRPEARLAIEAGLEHLAQATISLAVRADKFGQTRPAIRGELAVANNDPGALADYAVDLADRLGLEGAPHQLAAAWARQTMLATA